MTAVLEPALRSPDREEDRDTALRRAAARVLLSNWTGAATVPSRTLYPHQWSWDSAFIAIGLARLAPRRAQRELETLLGAQWRDGRVPHIVFNPSVPLDAYFPSPDFWRSSGAGAASGAPADIETSGIVQPPVHALAAWQVHLADPAESRRRGFLRRMYPRLAAWHRYLAASRDLGGGGLAAVVHPWEPGLDNSPVWDAALARVEPAPPESFRRADLDHSEAADRPTDLDYGRYVRLAADYRDHGYDDARTPHAFALEDPCFNALFIASEHALAEIAAATGADPAPHRRKAAEATAALVERLWDPAAGVFLARDLTTGEAVGGHSVAGLVPLIVPGLPEAVARSLIATAQGERFGLGRVHLVPSYDLTAPEYDGNRYWRGPSWFNTAWLVHRGLRQHGADRAADALREQALDDARRTGFAEYVEPHSGQGRGIRRFSWTAALALDLLHRTPQGEPAR
ncbi:MGH1-like glycoside hydrolase domain-containing protein [Actinacidiphila glaucinigra]|uniref:MGH1-like glycoside hydrolase domain-containing protein n=1 Tax=Actinacidiphila glaucinigra TaxID=235986 RepID=UPI0029A2576A|nr:trehalase family glycosidase [Streptomyces sp. PA03-3a]